MRGVCENSVAFRLLGLLLTSSPSQQQEQIYYYPTSPTEARTLRRLVAAGLVEVRDGGHPLIITSLGRAYHLARDLGLSLPQLGYLACIRRELQNLFVAELSQGCYCRKIDSYFATIFPDLQAARIRSNLTAKKFISQQHIWHFIIKGPRFDELKAHAETLDFLYKWLEEQYNNNCMTAGKTTSPDPEFAQFFKATS